MAVHAPIASGDGEASGLVAARVLADGVVVPVDSGAGMRLLDELDGLGRYALAFTRSGLRETRFVWVHDGAWYAVCLTRERRAEGDERPPSAVVEIERARPPFGLTLRQLDVLTLLCGGLSNPQIGAHLHMTARTVSTHVARILAKLGQATRAGAAAAAIDQGLLRVPVPGGGRALGVLGVARVEQIAAGLAPTALPRPDPGWQRVLRPRLRPIRLGTVIDTATPQGGDGEEVRNGSALAIAELNARGGVAGRLIEQVLVEVDVEDRGSFPAALRRLVDEDVDAVIGGYSLFVEPRDYLVARDHGCPILTTMTSAEQASWVREDPASFGRVFQVCPTEHNYATGALDFLTHLRETGAWEPSTRLLLPVETVVDGGQPFGATARDLAASAGYDVSDALVVPVRDVDWAPVIAAIREDEPAAVVLTHFAPREAAAFQRAFVASGAHTLVYMIYSPSTPAFLRAAGAAAEGVVWSTVTGTYPDAAGREFRRRYTAAFGRPPGRALAGSAFDQVHVLALAWAQVGDAHRFAEVADELRHISHRGVNGVYQLGARDQTGRAYPLETADPSLGQAHLVFQVQDGEHRVLHPAPYGECAFRAPPWLTPLAVMR
jgi:branched-chain amino acid transport system substrate-binding protein